ncbi:hypothetical protein BHM03_00051595 [Ensete ventricosum]|nr:hypothetical protein BHM03_00051595 [Ensete ventricosum]
MQATRSGCISGSSYGVGHSSDVGPPSSAKRMLYIFRTKVEVSPQLGIGYASSSRRRLVDYELERSPHAGVNLWSLVEL